MLNRELPKVIQKINKFLLYLPSEMLECWKCHRGEAEEKEAVDCICGNETPINHVK